MSRYVHAFIASAPAEWLRRNGGLPEDLAVSTLDNPEGVPLAVQRQMLREVVRRGGESALFDLPAALADATDQPLLFVLLNSRDVDDFIDKEQRFGRFFHSDHRVRVLERGERTVELQHRAESGKPVREESLLVLAFHLAMFKRIGCHGLCARLPGSASPHQQVFHEGRSVRELPPGDCGRWRIEWREFHALREPMTGLDELLVSSSGMPDLSTGADCAVRVERLVNGDLARRWTVSNVANLLHTSARTLQRELSACDTSFSQLVDAVRVDAAAELLTGSTRSVTEIGYICGFSDSAHFSRRFKARKGTPPQAWRTAISAPPSQMRDDE
ncbi:MAG: helix-turn-helix transcriptional regulator [bacterium]|nr:helix-turn-helix transcriptional regulator [bacterium]